VNSEVFCAILVWL